MENIVLSPVSLNDLTNIIKNAVSAEFERKGREDLAEKLLSPSETCQLFQPKISLPTLAKWQKEGYLKQYRIGGHVYYKYSEVLEGLKYLKKYKTLQEPNKVQ